MPVTQQELGQRIRVAREECGLTQEQLGQAVGVSRAAITQIEGGARAVSSLELDKLAFAVGRDIRVFFAEEFVEGDALAALFRSDPQFAEQAELMRALQESLALGREVTNLEQLLKIDRVQLLAAAYDLPPPRSRWDAIQQGLRVASQERQRLGVGTAPIADIPELLESQGIRTGAVSLPNNISGLTLSGRQIGVFVVINSDHPPVRKRFSNAHEYAHVLIDRNRQGALSRAENRDELFEVRANAFAAEFLMPADGVIQFVNALGKGVSGRGQIAVFDEAEVVQAEQRAAPGSQDIQLYDVARLSHHFGVSRSSMLYRLKNLRLISETEHQRLVEQEERGDGGSIAEFLRASEPSQKVDDRDDFRRRFLALALEAYRRDEISRSKLTELAGMVGVDKAGVQPMLTSAGLD